jgi:hypothetical protein
MAGRELPALVFNVFDMSVPIHVVSVNCCGAKKFEYQRQYSIAGTQGQYSKYLIAPAKNLHLAMYIGSQSAMIRSFEKNRMSGIRGGSAERKMCVENGYGW